jgi:hypothetical protein
MPKLDVAALLEKNPGVDKQTIKDFLANRTEKTQSAKQGGTASPYGRRRLVEDDRATVNGNAAVQYRTK